MSENQTLRQLRADAQAIFWAGIEAVDAQKAVARHLSMDVDNNVLRVGADIYVPLSQFKRVFIIGAGKAAAPMAAAVEEVISPAFLPEGVVNVKYRHTSPLPRFVSLNECGHPLPDNAGVTGARKIESILAQLTERDLLFVLVSGGASALLPSPADGISLEEKQNTTELLLRAGADIYEMNAVRKHLSTLKGGQLAMRAGRATVLALLLSDVIGDRLDVIGSGLTAPDPSTFSDALKVLEKYDLVRRVPASVMKRLTQGARGEIPETPKKSSSISAAVHNVVVGSNRLAIQSAAHAARALGYQTIILSSTMQGETREVARVHAEILREVVSSGNPVQPPACLLSGGETTVTVRGDGKGGRNQEFALAAAIAVAGLPNAVILAAGTDGTDGPTDAAGAMIDGTTLARATAMGLSPIDHLNRNDSYAILDALGELFKTGLTGTNVMDLNIMLAGGK
jgi:hydroxypyruvate reductase